MVKEELHELVDSLPESEMLPAKRFLEFLLENVHRQHFMQVLDNAPEEDEYPDEEELAAIEEAREDIKAGRVRDYSEFKKEFGL